MRPRPNGRGALLSGGVPGNKGGTGRPPKLIRAGLREAIPVEVAKLEAGVAKLEAIVAEFDAIDRTGATAVTGDDAIARRESLLRARMALEERLLQARRDLLDYRGKYGLGTTITETDADGETPPGKLSDAERADEIARILAERT